MAKHKPYDAILYRDGTSRTQREETVLLNPGFVLPDERSFDDIFRFAAQFAEKINFFSFEEISKIHPLPEGVNINHFIKGTWKEFFSAITSAQLSNKEALNNFDPHLALFFSFIKLFEHARDQLNQFTQKHLDFYYEKVLNLSLQPGLANNAYVIFELARNAQETLIEEGALLNAGKIEGKNTFYALTEDSVINKSEIASLRTVHLSGTGQDVLHFAVKSDTADGVKQPLPSESPYWDAFGLRHTGGTAQKKKTGFAIASPMLLLKGGNRTIKVSLQLGGVPQDMRTAGAASSVELFFTAEKKWLGPFSSGVEFGSYDPNTRQQKLKITCTLDNEEEGVLPYNAAVHGAQFPTVHPLMQVLVDTTAPGNLFGFLKQCELQKTDIELEVNGIANLTLENDSGIINPKKPFLPFGPTPRKGASFTVYYEELMKKNITEFDFTVHWMDAPVNFGLHYEAYQTHIADNNYFSAGYMVKGEDMLQTQLFHPKNAGLETSWPAEPAKPRRWIPYSLAPLLATYTSFYGLNSNPNYKFVLKRPLTVQELGKVPAAINKPLPQKGFVSFTLNKGFLHEEYGRVYTAQAIKKAAAPNDAGIQLPKEPYSPTIKHFVLNYKAVLRNVDVRANSFAAFNRKEIQFFHLGVFGEAEQHAYLKARAREDFGPEVAPFNDTIHLFPVYKAGEFYIGLKNAVAGQSLSLLFQLIEGSSNPDRDQQAVEWSVLCSNEWFLLKTKHLLKDETNQLLQTGIVRMVIPSCANTDNTWMDSGMTWLRATVQQYTDAIALFHKVLPQAAKAVLVTNNENVFLQTIPAETIAKMVDKKAEVKTVSQPFASLGGRAVENRDAFNMRVSERLRHKQRAVTAWDYERIVLQAFPALHKVKCLNHFDDAGQCCKEVSPGHVTLVVIPDLKERNAFNPLEPKVSNNLREQIRRFLQPCCSFFNKIHVVNPDYETVLLRCKIRFRSEGDFGLFRGQLNEAVKQFLTPWAYSETAGIRFGGTVRKSVLLNFIEERPYVDFVTDLELLHLDENGVAGPDVDTFSVINPKAVLVSHPQHQFLPYIPNVSQ